MPALTLYVHGAMPPGERERIRLESSLGADMRALGHRSDRVTTYAWRSGHPGGAALAVGGLALLGGGLLGIGARAAWLAATAGAAGGAAATYRAARFGIESAARGLAAALHGYARQYEQIHVVAHSLGTDVAIRALQYRAEAGHRLPGTLITLGGTARADRDHGHLPGIASGGVVNVYNPADLALWLELPVRLAPVIGRSGMRGAGIENIRTDRGHHDQVAHLAELLRPDSPAPHPVG